MREGRASEHRGGVRAGSATGDDRDRAGRALRGGLVRRACPLMRWFETSQEEEQPSQAGKEQHDEHNSGTEIAWHIRAVPRATARHASRKVKPRALSGGLPEPPPPLGCRRGRACSDPAMTDVHGHGEVAQGPRPPTGPPPCRHPSAVRPGAKQPIGQVKNPCRPVIFIGKPDQCGYRGVDGRASSPLARPRARSPRRGPVPHLTRFRWGAESCRARGQRGSTARAPSCATRHPRVRCQGQTT